MRGHPAVDLAGRVFGRLTVIERAGTHETPSGQKKAVWLCRCKCGAEIRTQGPNLKTGITKSCGCLSREKARARIDAIQPLGAAAAGVALWKGDSVEYKAAHDRVRAAKGKASTHSCGDCGRQAEDWSYNGGCPRERTSNAKGYEGTRYSPDPDYYVARCKSCHMKYDRAERNFL